MMRLLAAILIPFLFACKTSEKTTPQEKETVETTSPIEFTVVKSGENSTYKTPQNIVISTQQEMDENWMKMFGNYSRKPPIPMVDFESKQLLLVAMGEQASGGYAIKINTIEKTSKEIVVTIEDSKPGKSCMTTSALVYPFQLVKMPKTTETISYTRIARINECE